MTQPLLERKKVLETLPVVSDFPNYLEADGGLTREKEEIIPNKTNDLKPRAKTYISTRLSSLLVKIKMIITASGIPEEAGQHPACCGCRLPAACPGPIRDLCASIFLISKMMIITEKRHAR